MRRLAFAVSVATLVSLNLLSVPTQADARCRSRSVRRCRPRAVCYVCAPCKEIAPERAPTSKALGDTRIVNVKDFGILFIDDQGRYYKYHGPADPLKIPSNADWRGYWTQIVIPQ